MFGGYEYSLTYLRDDFEDEFDNSEDLCNVISENFGFEGTVSLKYGNAVSFFTMGELVDFNDEFFETLVKRYSGVIEAFGAQPRKHQIKETIQVSKITSNSVYIAIRSIMTSSRRQKLMSFDIQQKAMRAGCDNWTDVQCRELFKGEVIQFEITGLIPETTYRLRYRISDTEEWQENEESFLTKSEKRKIEILPQLEGIYRSNE